MERFVAFLRGINLGKRRPPGSQLKERFEEMGFDEVETFQTLTSRMRKPQRWFRLSKQR